MTTGIVEKIRAAYERDKNADAVATAKSGLPLSYNSITADWLTQVLCKNVPGAHVTSFSLGPPDDGSSNRRTIHVRYGELGQTAALPRDLFCKATHDLANRIVLGVSGGARGEALFYREIRPLLKIETPRCYYAHYDEETYNSIIMLGDISGEVIEFCSDQTAISRARAESQIHLLAELHGSIYGNPLLQERIMKIPTWPEFFRGTLAFGMKQGSTNGFQNAESVIPARFFDRLDQVWPATLTAVAAHESLPHTLAHGDVHLKNWYVARSGQMGLADWQCCGRGHWSRDVAYAIATALTIDNRRAWERDLLHLYIHELAVYGGPRLEFDAAWLSYRQQLISALTWWTVTLTPPEGLPDMQPKRTALEFIRRIATAIDDLDSMDTFK
jgi:hypothetical protein